MIIVRRGKTDLYNKEPKRITNLQRKSSEVKVSEGTGETDYDGVVDTVFDDQHVL